jgi:uncharacterized membrane protein YdjX (TVP38/TMEM64 family)
VIILIDRESFLKKVIRLSAYGLLLAAAALLAWSIFTRIDWVEELPWYKNYLVFLEDLRLRVEGLPNRWIVFIIIESLFLLKCIVPVAPVSLVCLISSAVFPFYTALLINLSGLALMFSVRYVFGYSLGTDKVVKLLERYENTRKALEHDGVENPWLLFVFRFVPVFPTNRISGFYGSRKYDYKKFLLFSLLGYVPRLLSYGAAGRNMFQSFSFSFLSPLIVIFTISGISMLAVNEILIYTAEKSQVKKNQQSAQFRKESKKDG